MKNTRTIVLVLLLALILLLIAGCENFTETDAFNHLITTNDLSIIMKADTSSNYVVQKIYEANAESAYYLRITVADTFSLN